MITLLLLLIVPVDITPLPSEWHGTWQGTLQIRGNGDKITSVPFKLVVKPLEEKARVTWHITYGEGEKASTRRYELVALDKPGFFELDEKSGIRMKEHLLGKQLFCLFKVSNNLIHVKHELVGDVLRYDLTTYQEKNALQTHHEQSKTTTVDSYQMVNQQRAELHRQK
jgi:hypothetical protein